MSRGYDRKRSLQFEHTRVICYTIAAVNRTKEAFPSIEEFWKLPTDDDAIEEHKEDLNAMHARVLARLAAAFPTKFKN